MAVNIIFLLILVPLIFVIPILVGVYVYRDAGKRGMNAVLWLLVALLTPGLLGLIIYLLVRNNYSDLKCPNCNTQVEESYVVCPSCRTKLRPTCPSCAAPVQTAWKVCPHCGTELPVHSENVAAPVRVKDKTLGKILIAILVIPVVLILLLIVFALPFSMNSRSGGYATGFTSVPVNEYLSDCIPEEKAAVESWLQTVQSGYYPEPYHILEYKGDALPDEYDCQYLIYIPGACNSPDSYPDSSSNLENKGFFRKRTYLELDIICNEKGGEQLLFLFNYNSSDFDTPEELVITYNGAEGDSSLSTYDGTN